MKTTEISFSCAVGLVNGPGFYRGFFKINCMIDVIYDEVRKRIKKLLQMNRISEQPEEFINEAWVHLTTSGHEITTDSLYRKARTFALHQKDKQTTSEEFSRITTKFCKGCNEDLPIAAFGLSFCRELNKRRVNNKCKSCDRRIGKEKNASGAASRNARERTEKLTDGYIKKNLRNLGFKNYSITSLLIEQARERIIKKRMQRNSMGSTSDRFETFMRAYKDGCNISVAAKSVGIARSVIYRRLRRDQAK